MHSPAMFRIRQHLSGPALPDPAAAVRDSIRALGLESRITGGQSVAITAGSRGIANIATIMRAVVDEMKRVDLGPFIVPAMGSHGGATAEGQRRVLEHYGIVESSMGCDIRSSMEVVEIGNARGIPVFCDKYAWEADHIAVVGRIKQHPDLDGAIQSGLFKMMAIGLGKQRGAEHYHRAGFQWRCSEIFPLVGRAVLESGHVLFGLAIVENGYEQTAEVRALLPGEFEAAEKALLADADAWMARLPFEAFDLLIVDEMGKSISGAGMDPIVIGRASGEKIPSAPRIHLVFARDLLPGGEGNAVGIGLADLTTWRLVKQINYQAMYMNAITGGTPHLARVPVAFDTDREAIRAALGMIGLTPPEHARVVRIKNTLHLTEMDVSEAMLPDVERDQQLTVTGGPSALCFNAEGNLEAF